MLFPALLPLEIFKDITTYLSNDDVVVCQTVCSSWYKKWTAYKYHHVYIKGKSQFQTFLKTLQHPLYPPGTPFSVGYQIRELIIENGHIDPSILGQLPMLCPYLEVFMFDGVKLSEAARKKPYQHEQIKNKEEIDEFKHCFSAWSQMRHVTELNGIAVPLILLQYPTNLVSISVQFINQNDNTNSKSKLLRSLHHAPFLQTFSVERIFLNMEELEMIHSSCPDLKSLYLIEPVLLPTAVKKSVMPAKSFKSLHFINGSFCDGVIMWLDYISKKYINAKTINIGTCSFSSVYSDTPSLTEDVPSRYEPQLLQLAQKCLKLKSLSLQSFVLGKHFYKRLDQSGTMLEELTVGDGRTMDLANELTDLLSSLQHHYIQIFTVNSWPLSTDRYGYHLLLVSLHKCTNLTTLKLSMGRQLHQSDPLILDTSDLHFDLVLRACPQLTSLSIMNAKLVASDFRAVESACLFPLESLRLENVLLDSGSHIFQIISSHCPHMKNLYLISTIPSPIYHNTRNFNIYLPHHRLQTLVLDRVRVSQKCNIRLGTTKFKMTSNQGVFWYDLEAYEYYNNRRFVRNQPVSTTGQIHTSDNVVMQPERMRAKKVKKWLDAEISYSTLDQHVYVSVYCKEILSLYLSGLCIV